MPRPLDYATPAAAADVAPPAALSWVSRALVAAYLLGYAALVAYVGFGGRRDWTSACWFGTAMLVPTWVAVALVLAAADVEDRRAARSAVRGHVALAAPWLVTIAFGMSAGAVPSTFVALAFWTLIAAYAGLHLASACLTAAWRRRLPDPPPPRAGGSFWNP